MKRLILIAAAALSLGACNTTGAATGGSVASIPGAAPVCVAINSDKFDLALKAYGAAVDAVDLLIDGRVLTPGTPRALAVANANDKVLAAFAVAQHARQACNSTGYLAALGEVQAAIAEVRLALRS